GRRRGRDPLADGSCTRNPLHRKWPWCREPLRWPLTNEPTTALPYRLAMTTLEVETPHGPALVHLHRARDPRAALVLGHGAGGGIEAPDLVAATEAAGSEG